MIINLSSRASKEYKFEANEYSIIYPSNNTTIEFKERVLKWMELEDDELDEKIIEFDTKMNEILEELLEEIEIDKEIGKLAGEFVKRYGKSHSVKLADALIGAATIVRGMKLWTFNKKHYPMFNEKEFY